MSQTFATTTADMPALAQHMDPDARAELDAVLTAGDAPIWLCRTPCNSPRLGAFDCAGRPEIDIAPFDPTHRALVLLMRPESPRCVQGRMRP